MKETDMARKIKVVVCSGTACYVMGSSEILLLEEHLTAEQKERVEIEGTNCLGFCKNGQNGRNGKAPYVTVDGSLLSSATVPAVIEKIQELLDA